MWFFPPFEDGLAQVSLVNCSGMTQKLEKGLAVGEMQPVEVISNLVSDKVDRPSDDEEIDYYSEYN